MLGAATPGGSKAPSRLHGGPLEALSRHRRFNSGICRSLASDNELIQMAKDIGNCASRIAVEVGIAQGEDPVAYLRGAKLCNRRLCPFCEWRRTRAWRARLHTGLSAFQEAYPTHKGVFLTLTVRNIPLTELNAQLKEMNRGWNRLTKSRQFPTPYWFRRTEVTVGVSDPLSPVMAHPHFHALLLVPASYWGRAYVKQTEWQKRWMEAMRLDYAPIVDVRAAKASKRNDGSDSSAISSAVLEAAKYATKASDLLELGPATAEYQRQIHGVRLYATSRGLGQYVGSSSLSGEELLDARRAESPEVDSLYGFASWFEDSQEYLFTSL